MNSLPSGATPACDQSVDMLTETVDQINRLYREGSIEYKQFQGHTIVHCLENAFKHGAPPSDRIGISAATFWLRVLEGRRNKRTAIEHAPSWLTAEILSDLLAEAESQRPNRPGVIHQTRGTIAHIARQHLLENQTFLAWLEKSADVKVRGISQMEYIFYDNPGQYCSAHVDEVPEVEYNCLICLKHQDPERAADRNSFLRLFTCDGISDYDMDAGSVVVIHSSQTAHARTPVADGEQVWMLSVEFFT
jgi:hypothetical protein